MSNVINNILSIPELRKRILYTLLFLAIFRIGTQIPVPMVNPQVLEERMAQKSDQGGGDILDFFDLFTGGALQQLSLFTLGIMPYISSSIIMQLLQVVIPHLERLAKEGDYGRKKIQKYTKYGTLFLCIVQGIGLLFWIKNPDLKILDAIEGHSLSTQFTLTFLITTTTGTMFLLWLGEQITNKGIGNGVSLIIMGGIIARLPHSVYQLFMEKAENPISILIVLTVFVLVIGLVTIDAQAVRKIPVQYAKRVVGPKIFSPQATHIPFKINPSGVIPIIFASSVILFPTQIAYMFGRGNPLVETIANALRPGQLGYSVLYMLLVIFFAYFYTAIYFNPAEIAENMKKQGGFIPGIRPGQNTANFLSKMLNRITLPGSIFLGLIAIFPDIVQSYLKISANFARLMGGTSILIMVGVALDTVKQIESHLLMRNYKGFLKKGKIIGRR